MRTQILFGVILAIGVSPMPTRAEGEKGEPITNSIGMKLVLIPAGEFLMGTVEPMDEVHDAFGLSEQSRLFHGLDNEYPQHRVRISKPFYLGTYEVTKYEFAKFVGETGYKTDSEKDGKGGEGFDGKKFKRKPEHSWRSWGMKQSDQSPVVNVSHNDAREFCEWLSRKEKKRYRLPTEAEWEYACRAGTNTRFYNGDDPERLMEVGNVPDASLEVEDSLSEQRIKGNDGWSAIAPKGQFRANAFGLYDMHGNVAEWCSDWFDLDLDDYAKSPEVNPQGTASSYSRQRMYRGGHWLYYAIDCRSAARGHDLQTARLVTLGFRVAAEQ